MKSIFSKQTITKSVHAHSVVGITIGAFMYLLCLTGTLLVVADYWERWEQPTIPEFSSANGNILDTALEEALARVEQVRDSEQGRDRDENLKEVDQAPETLYLVLPTATLPRLHVSVGNKEWWTDAQGHLLGEVESTWTELVKNIHLHLLLPKTLGMIIVSIIGALFVGLIISGVIAHPSIFKDAFKWRVGGSRRLETLDLHNRLSVWALPFHLMIGITGAFFGLVGFLVVLAAQAFYDGDREALFNDVYGADPVVSETPVAINFNVALAYLEENYTETHPIYVAVHHYGTERQFFEIAATFPRSLTYSEIFRFHSNGEFMNRQNLVGGSAGRQILYSVYRLHFGWFGGLGIQILYLALGFSLTVVSVSGINLWLQKKEECWLHKQWLALVWGVPLGLVIAAVSRFGGGSPGYALLATWILCAFFCQYPGLSLWARKKTLLILTCGSLAAIVIWYLVSFGTVMLEMNIALVTGVSMWVILRLRGGLSP